MLSACATQQNHYDPIESTNRVTDKVNDGIDRITLKPLAQGYNYVVPKPMRTAVSNFYDNSTYINTVLNDFLQGKGQQGFMDFMRFLINSTLGVGGLVDVATSMGFDRHDEDFGQTLATWGVSKGAYIIYPLFGPNSVRNTPDFLTATATNPLFWAGFVLAPYVTIPVTALNYVDTRSRLLSASDMRDELALDPYVFTREAWRQRRDYLIYDGNPPVSPVNEDDGFEDDGFEEDGFDNGNDPQPESKAHPNNTAPKNIPAPVPAVSSPSRSQTTPTKAFLPEPAAISASDSVSANDAREHYVIFLSSHHSESEAVAEQSQIARLGIGSDIFPVTLNHRRWYRIRSGSYANKSKAFNELKRLKSLTGLNGAWIEASGNYSPSNSL